MRRVLVLLCAVAFALPSALVYAQGESSGKGSDDELLRRSDEALGSYPGGPGAKAPLSTGYYVADNEAPTIGSPWAPSFQFLDTTGSEIQAWRRILSGPKQRTPDFWQRPESEGHGYFRNPNNMNDSTDNAFAGPINIGFPFYYYGRKYDSFYVTTNGLLALSNRRYQYDELGRRTDYEPVSDDPAARSGNAVTDPVADDYGYRVVALGSSTAATAGILNPGNNQFPQGSLKAVIAPLWDDQELSQYNPAQGRPDDFGKAYYRRDPSNNRLIVYWANMSMIGTKNHPLGGSFTAPFRGLRANVQVVLDRSDSTVQFNYRFPTTDQFNNAPVNILYGMNATIGVQSHDQEFTNYLNNGSLKVNGDVQNVPKSAMAIKFKQWRNIVRVVRVTFQVPSRFVAGSFIDLPAGQLIDNYELLLGHPILGVVRPVGTVQNTSSDVGPVNVVRQPIRFNVVFRIRDLININATPPYQRTETTTDLYPIFGSNALRPSEQTILFDPYYTNQNVLRQSGRFRAEIITTDRGPNGENYGQEWPFDDTTGVRVFGIRRLEPPVIASFDDYDISFQDGIIPSVQQWVAIGPQVRDGEENTYNPPPPRGSAAIGRLASPVVVFDRKEHNGNYYFANQPGRLSGDTLISFPINISGMLVRPVIVLSYQRSGKQQNGYPRGFSDVTRIGPEHMVYNAAKNGIFAEADYMMLEFAEPSSNGLDGIVNISEWRDVNFTDLISPIRWSGNSPRWAVFGGGGYSDTLGRIISNEFDAGKDFEFNRAYIPVPARWWKNTAGNKYFRFRIRTQAKMDGSLDYAPADDADEFYVDNIMLIEPDKPEIEITTVKVDWPYTEAPASQASAIPLAVKLGNNGGTTANSFGVAMYVENRDAQNPPGFFSYYRYRSIISIAGGADLVERFPEWNAQECGANITPINPRESTTTRYRIWARVLPENNDSYPQNDVQYTDFNLTLGPTFAYDDASNDVPGFATLPGKGLNLVPPTADYQGSTPYGPTGGTTSGTFAMQFRILTRDTIHGYQAYYGGANQAPDVVLYSIYEHLNDPGNPPSGLPIPSSRVYARRGEGIPSVPRAGNPPYNFDQYVTYLLDTPLVVEPGTYFATVAQLGETGLELGGDANRMGQVTTVRVDNPQGQGNYSIPAHPEMQRNIFWFEVTTESGNWTPMISLTNNPGFPHLDWRGLIPSPANILTHTRGSWIPMIRPYFGAKPSQNCMVEPVELSSFELTNLSNALRLDWKTATETNNHGFYIERRAKDQSETWNDLAFQQGAGNSNQVRDYSYVDNSVALNTTYQYRLRQEDRDGSVNYSGIKEGRINSIVAGSSNSLSQNTPNPFSTSTTINFRVVESNPVQLEINDVYGNTIRTFAVDAQAGAQNEIVWDGRDQSGSLAPNGVYVYKIVGNGVTLSRKLTIAR